eukprot:84347_1
MAMQMLSRHGSLGIINTSLPNHHQNLTSNCNIDIPYDYSSNQKIFKPSINNSSYDFTSNRFTTHNNPAHIKLDKQKQGQHYPKHMQTTTSNTNKNISIPHQTSSTISLAAFACDIEKEITNKVLKKLNLNQKK